MKAFVFCVVSLILCPQFLSAQEANSGFDLRSTFSAQGTASSLSTEPPRSGSAGIAGARSVFYPLWKLNSHWSVSGTWQLYTRPYFYETLTYAGHGANGNLLQASLNYARVSDKGSLLVRAGQLSTAFGSFLLRYDDAENAVVDLPMEYGYYYARVSSLSVAGAQIDATRGKWDGRAQFANSSPANPRSIFQHDQYGNWAGGGGYTIRQGFRVGGSAYRGPYLDRQYKYFFPGEANPNTLPAHALGLDVEWARGYWNVQGELQSFVMPYKVIPTVREQAGYGEIKRALTPRWYVAGRVGYTRTETYGHVQSYEAAGGFRPDRLQLIKIDYEYRDHSTGTYRFDKILSVQVVTTLHFSAARE